MISKTYMRNVLQFITAIYPIYIILLIIIPYVTGLIINYNLIDSRELLINLVWLPFFTVPYFLFQKKFIYYTATTIYFINGFVNVCHWILVKGPLTASSLFVFFTTNYEESIGFLDLKSDLYFLFIIPYIIVFIIALRNPSKSYYFKHTYHLIYIISLISIFFVIENIYHHRLIRKGLPILFKSTIIFNQEIQRFKEKNRNFKKSVNIHACAPQIEKNQIYVLIIGESANRNHMSLYGYSKQTNPKLTALQDIIVYKNVVSGYSNTINSILSSLTQSNLENNLDFSKCISILDIYRAAGFKTYWISNQSPIGIWDNVITLFAQNADVSKFVNISGSASFESINTTSYDEKLFPFLKNCLHDNNTKKFIVLHLMGSHSTYSARYPSAYLKFHDFSSKKNKIISEYDNSIVYNDFVVDSLFKIIQNYAHATNSICASIYLSDHGENVYDENDYVGHDFAQNMSKNNVEIPFIIWLSKEYKKTFIEQYNIMLQNKNKPFVTDDLFHALIDLTNINTPYLDKKRSIFNSDFNDKRLRILVDGKNYDR